MKTFIATMLSIAILCVTAVGCADKSTSKTESKVTTPGGETTTTTERTVKQTGENPPPPANNR